MKKHRFRHSSINAQKAFALLLCVCMLLGALGSGIYLILSQTYIAAEDGIMPYAENVPANIIKLNFDNNNVNSGGRLRNEFQNGITATLRGNYTNNIYYSIYGDYAFFPDHSSDKGYLTLAYSDGSGGILDGLTELSVEMDMRVYGAGGPYYLFYASPDESSPAHVAVYVGGSKLTAEMVDASGNSSSCTFTARRNGTGGEIDFSDAGKQTFKFTFSDNGNITVYINGTERTENVSRSSSGSISSLADCLVSSTGTNGQTRADGIVWLARKPGDSDMQGFYGYMDDIVITGRKNVEISASNDPVRPTYPTGTSHTNEDWNNALHFVVRHWHSVGDPNTQYQGGTGYDATADRFFVVGEGYIVPYTNNTYRFYMVDQSKEGVDKYQRLTGGNGNGTYNGPINGNSYIDRIEESNGVIEFVESPVKDANGESLDTFSGFAVSAGHAAVASAANTNDENKNAKITITYDTNIHLVKTHFFYIDAATDVKNQDLFGGTSETEKDTAYVYTFTRDYTYVNGSETVYYTVGDILEYKTSGNTYEPVYYKKGLPGDLTDHGLPQEIANYIELTKVYNTSEGLHTDKTASEAREYGDGRTFNLDLEAWYSGSSPVDVGLVLDSSGSMGFASEDLKPININNWNLSQTQLNQLNNKKTNSSNFSWSNVFLSLEQVGYLLDTQNTDNSRLGETGYNYYVYDARDTVKEYVPLAYWGGNYTKVIGSSLSASSIFDQYKDNIVGYVPFEGDPQLSVYDKNNSESEPAYTVKQNTAPGWSEQNQSGKAGSETPSNLTGKISISGAAMMLPDSTRGLLMPKKTGENFSVTFTLTANGSFVTATNASGYVDLLYAQDTKGTGNSLRIRVGNNGCLYILKSNSNTVSKLGDKILTGNSDSHMITVTFAPKGSETAVYIYCDGNAVGGGFTMPALSSENYVIFSAFPQEGTFSPKLYVDDIFVFNTTFSSSQAKAMGGGETYVAMAGNHKIGSVDARYCGNKYDTGSDGKKGWYYVNHTSSWESAYIQKDVETGKQFSGLIEKAKFGANYNTSLGGTIGDIGYFTDTMVAPASHTALAASGDTGKKYTENDGLTTSETKFFIDANGYLRCFFYTNGSDDAWRSSFVYYCDDSSYVKAEALQRAIGFFTTKLREKSEHTLVSATRFSTDQAKNDLDKLVMLDWTNDNSQIQNIMSLERGTGTSSKEGGTLGYDSSKNGIKQYNYGLTGQTSTKTGLQSFLNYLATNNSAIANDGHKKYLIVFTDGRDTDINFVRNADNSITISNNEAAGIAKTLREDYHYTIFCVMLTGGPVTQGSVEFDVAKAFLETLASDPSYVFTTEDYVLGNASTQSKVDQLTDIFTRRILTIMMDTLENYEIKDYIDPRFDLVEANVPDSTDERTNGSTWHLNAGGKVTVKNADGTTVAEYNLSNGSSKEIWLSSDVEEKAQKAWLYYDSGANLYYLRWVNQTIPNGMVGITDVEPWKGRITVRAKDDFLGGNDVLTNGNAVMENYVYSSAGATGDGIANSSGINDTKKSDTNDFVSKGFPRTTVNVTPPLANAEAGQIIYEGESLDAEEIAKRIIDLFVNRSDEDLTESERRAKYYWEYLYRYSLKTNTPLSTLIQNIINTGEKGYDIPYYYLDDSNDNTKTTQTGGNEHRSDRLGTLKYVWTQAAEGYPSYPSDEVTKDTQTRRSELSVTYTPDTADTRWGNNSNDTLVTETAAKGQGAYEWDRDRKPEVGTDAKGETSTGAYTTEIVSGEIILQMKVSEEVKEALGDGTITYTANLKRVYNGVETIVGTYTVTYTNDSSTGESVVTATFTPTGDYASYVKENGLPIGTYTLVPDSENTDPGSLLLRFKTLKNIVITEDNSELFLNEQIKTDPEKEAHAHDYPAPCEGNDTARLGSTADRHASGAYLDDLYALFQIELETVGAIKVQKKAFPSPDGIKFGFTIMLTSPSGKAIDPKKYDVINQDGEHITLEWEYNPTSGIWSADFRLGDGDWIGISGLEDDIKYIVREKTSELDDDYYLFDVGTNDAAARSGVEFGGGEGTTVVGKEWTWTFTNMQPAELPSTGPSEWSAWFCRLAGMTLILAAGVVLYTRKLRRGN